MHFTRDNTILSTRMYKNFSETITLLHDRLVNVRTLDLSNNKLKNLSVKLSNLKSIKSLNVEKNQLQTLLPIAKLTNLQTLNAGKNNLGIAPQKKLESKQKSPASKTASSTSASALASVHHHQSLPELPPSLKQLKLDSNHFDSIPKQILTNSLTKLVKVDLSHNNIASVPAQISLLSSLTELNLSYNMIPRYVFFQALKALIAVCMGI